MRWERMRRRSNAPVSVIGSARGFPPGLRAGAAPGGGGSAKWGGEFFHAPPLLAAQWSAEHVSPDSMAYLAGLPESLRLPEGILIVHGAPSAPDRHLFPLDDAV